MNQNDVDVIEIGYYKMCPWQLVRPKWAPSRLYLQMAMGEKRARRAIRAWIWDAFERESLSFKGTLSTLYWNLRY